MRKPQNPEQLIPGSLLDRLQKAKANPHIPTDQVSMDTVDTAHPRIYLDLSDSTPYTVGYIKVDCCYRHNLVLVALVVNLSSPCLYSYRLLVLNFLAFYWSLSSSMSEISRPLYQIFPIFFSLINQR